MQWNPVCLHAHPKQLLLQSKIKFGVLFKCVDAAWCCCSKWPKEYQSKALTSSTELGHQLISSAVSFSWFGHCGDEIGRVISHLCVPWAHRAGQFSILLSLAEAEEGGDFPLALSGELCLPSSVTAPMFWECCHTCELPLGLRSSITHLSCAGEFSGNLHFSQSLLSKKAFWIPWLHICWMSWHPTVPELVRCLPYRMRTFYSSSRPSCLCLQSTDEKSFSLRYSFSFFPTRTCSGSSAGGWFLLDFMIHGPDPLFSH